MQGDTVSLQGDIFNQAVVLFDQESDGVYRGKMLGGGTLVKENIGKLTLMGKNSHTGGTVIKNGTLSGDTTSLSGDIINDSFLEFDQAIDGAYDGIISGKGKVVKENSGLLWLTGANKYEGETAVFGGVLRGNAISLQGDIYNEATVEFDQKKDGEYCGVIQGKGGVKKSNEGRLIFSGAHHYEGGTTIMGGTLQGNSTSLQGDFDNRAALLFDQETDGKYSGKIFGVGVVGKEGSGKLTLTEENFYTGGTVVSAGILEGNAVSLQGDILNHAVVVFDQESDGVYRGRMLGVGTLVKENIGKLILMGENSHRGGTVIKNGMLSGDTRSLGGDIINDSFLEFDQAIDGTYAGVISGKGRVIKENSGVLWLTGANKYEGDTGVFGGVLRGNAISLQGDIYNQATLEFDQEEDGEYGGIIYGKGGVKKSNEGRLIFTASHRYEGGTVVMGGTLQGNTTTLQGDFDNRAVLLFDQEEDGEYSGKIFGLGLVAKEGSGKLTLTGENFYTGGTVIRRGVLEGDAVSLQGDILNDGVVVFNQKDDGNYCGAMRGSGSLVKENTGVLTLMGNNLYEGGTVVKDGKLIGNTDSFQGNILNHSVLEFDQAIDGTYAGVISGKGKVIKENSGQLLLTGANEYEGETAVFCGTLQGNTVSLRGNIYNEATVEFDQKDQGTYEGVISGKGMLTKSNDGRLILTGAHDYQGGTQVTAGTLQGDVVSLQGDINNQAKVIFDQKNEGVYAGKISGKGVLFKENIGKLILTGENDYTGGTVVKEGVLQGNATGLQGDILNHAIVVFDQEFEGKYCGKMEGKGSLIKENIGMLTLTGENSYTGETLVREGALRGDTKSLTKNINNRGTVIFDQWVDAEYVGTIKGSGNVIKKNAGVLTLMGHQFYEGGTTIAEGGIRLSVTDALPVIGAVELQDRGAFLDLNECDQTLSGLAGFEGTIITNGLQKTATLTIESMENHLFNGVIEDNVAVVKKGSGTVRLNGLNTYTGGTKVGGGKIELGTRNGLPVNGIVDLFGEETVLDLNSFEQTIGVLRGSPSSIVTSNGDGVAVLRVGNEVSHTFSGIIEDGKGVVSLVKQGSGILTLEGANRYLGGTTVEGGILRGNTLTLKGDITNQATVIFDQEEDGIYDGVMSGVGNFIKKGDARLTLMGKNLYEGGTTVRDGVLQGDATTLQGDISNHGIVLFDQVADGVYRGKISGEGGAVKEGDGKLMLVGENSYIGGTVIRRGTLSGDTQSLQGNIVNESVLEFNQAIDGEYIGIISGKGSVIKENTGILGLIGANRYEGETAVLGGVLKGNTVSLRGDIRNEAMVEFDQQEDGIYEGIIYGQGGVKKSNEGRLTLSGLHRYKGGTLVTAGVLQGDATTLQGNIDNRAVVVFDQKEEGFYDGEIFGQGSLVKESGGKLTLTGKNSYSGGTTVVDGVLQGNAMSLQGGILNHSVVVFDQEVEGIYHGVISGDGKVIKENEGRLIFKGENGYEGGTVVRGGVLRGDAKSLQGDIINDSVLEFDQAVDGEYAGVISGKGSVIKENSGVLSLTGANQYEGETAVFGGVLRGNTISLRGKIHNEGVVEFDQAVEGSYEGFIHGKGGVLKSNEGKLILLEEQSYEGGTRVFGGLLEGNSISLRGDIDNESVIIFNQQSDGVYEGKMSGRGALIKKGDGRLILSGKNQYIGRTTVSEGILQGNTTGLQGDIINNSIVVFDQEIEGTYSGKISGKGKLIKQNSGTLILKGEGGYSGDVVVTSGVLKANTQSLQGNIENEATVIFDQPIDGTYHGNISGSGKIVKENKGVFTLAGVNGYTGGSYVVDGALKGDAMSLQGDIENQAAVIFDQEIDGFYGGKISGSGTVIKENSGTLVLTGENSFEGGTVVHAGTLKGDTVSLTGDIDNRSTLIFDQPFDGFYKGVIFGSGSVEKQNKGIVVLSGLNVYTGETIVSDGTLMAGGKNVFSPFGSVTLSGQGVVDLGQFDQTIGNLSGSEGSFVTSSVVGGVTLTVGNANDGIFSGIIEDGCGTVTLVKQGSGLLKLTEANTYSGGSFVTSGSLEGDTKSLQGDIHNDGAVIFDQSFDGIYAGNLSGKGTVFKKNKGITVFTGINEYQGGTVVTEGVLQGDTRSLQGDITNDGAVVFDQGIDGTYSGVLSGTGAVFKKNKGVTVFTGMNQYEGGTFVEEGVLQGDTTSLRGPIDNQADLIFDQVEDGTYLGGISGAGRVIKQSGGKLILEGLNSYQGGTVVAEGILQGNAMSLQGNIVNNSAIVFEQEGYGAFQGEISGSGKVTKTSTGILTLEGENSYTGGTIVEAGILRIGAANSLPANGVLELANPGSVLDLNSFNETIQTLKSVPGSIITNSLEGSAILTTASDENQEFHGTIEDGKGTVKWVKKGKGVLTLKGPNNHKGGFVVAEGVLQGNTTTLSGAIQNDATLLFDQKGDGNYVGTISGTGALIKTSKGTLTLSSRNTHTGGTMIVEGRLKLGIVDALPNAGHVELMNEGALLDLNHFDQTISGLRGSAGTVVTSSFPGAVKLQIEGEGQHTFSGTIEDGEGSVSLVKGGQGSFTLSGSNQYTGGTKIEGGRLKLGTTNALPVGGSVDLFNEEATLDLNGFEQTIGFLTGVSGSVITTTLPGVVTLKVGNEIDHVFDGDIRDGAGIVSLLKQGSGSLTLAGTNTYIGGTMIAEGTLKLGKEGALSTDNVVTLANSGAVLDLNGHNHVIGGLKGVVGTLVTTRVKEDVNLTVGETGNYTFDGIIADGEGRLSLTKRGSGFLMLSRSNHYTGETVIEQGSLRLGAGNALSPSTVVSLLNRGAVLDLNGFNQEIAGLRGVSEAVVTNDAADLGSEVTLAIGNEENHAFKGVIKDGENGGRLSLAKKGSGTLTLSGSNSYSGKTTVASGVLQLGKKDTLPTSGVVDLFVSGAVLDLNNFDQTVGNLKGTEGSLITNSGEGDVVLTAGNDGHEIFSGVIEDGAGTVGFVKQGSGTLLLTGKNRYTGKTRIDGGILQGHTESLQGDFENEGTVLFTQLNDGVFTGVISGSGHLKKEGPGVLNLVNNHIHQGDTVVLSGTIKAGASNVFSSSSLLNLAEGVVVDLSCFDQKISNLTGGRGALITTQLEGSTTLTTGDSTDQVFSGSIQDGQGSISLVKLGEGVLTFDGANDYTGGTVVANGVLRGNTESLKGDILNHATVVFDQKEAGTYRDRFSGAGDLVKESAGSLELSGDLSDFTGNFTIQEGEAFFKGETGASVFLAPSGTLRGTGKLGFVENRGTLIAGGSIGTVFIQNNYIALPSSTLVVEVNETESSLVIVGGTATLSGQLQIVQDPGVYQAGRVYTILTAGLVQNQFQSVVQPGSLFSVQYLSNAVQLFVNANQLIYPSVTLYGNAGRLGSYLFCSTSTISNPDLLNVVGALFNLTGQAYVSALNELTPSQFGALPLSELESNYRVGNLFLAALGCERCFQDCNERAGSAPRPPSKRHRKPQVEKIAPAETRIRVTPFGFATKYNHVPQETPKFNEVVYGVTVVAERAYSNGFTVGGGVGYSHDKIDWRRSQGSATANSVYLGPTFMYESKRFYSGLLLLGAANFYDVDRTIQFPGVNRKATNHHTSWDVVTKAVIGGIFRGKRGLSLQPAVSVEYFNSFEESYHEEGANSINLSVSSQYSAYIRSLVGMELSKEWFYSHFSFRPGVSLSWLMTAPTTANQYQAKFTQGTFCQNYFKANSYHNDINQVQVGGNFCFKFGERSNLKLAYEGAFGEGNSTQEGIISFFYEF